MITYVYIDNYRGFSKSWIPLKKVNFLVGENSTGKTSFLELLGMFCQPSYWVLQPNFGIQGAGSRHFLDLVSAASKSKKKFTVGSVSVYDGNGDGEVQSGMIVTYQNLEGRPVPCRVSIVEGASIRTIDGNLSNGSKGEKYGSRSRRLPDMSSAIGVHGFLQKIEKIHGSASGFEPREVSEEKSGTPLFYRCDDALFDKGYQGRVFSIPSTFQTSLVEFAPIRTKPKRTYDAPQTAFSPEGEHTPYVIRKRLASKTQAERFSEFLKKIGRDSGLFEQISVKSYGSGPLSPFEIKVVLGRAALGMENVGYGVSQALPVIVEIFVRAKGATFMVQQPEVHLHPKAQASIGDMIAEFAREEDKRFFVETHSDFTIDRFRLNIRRGGAVDSQLLFFERKEKGNCAVPIQILENGDLPESQPAGYRDFFFNESLSLLG